MDSEKFTSFCNCFDIAFQKLVSNYQELNFTRQPQPVQSKERKLSTIVGVVGLNKGRIHVEMDEGLAKKLYEQANGEKVEDDMDLCFFLAEFTNMITGNGITKLNDIFKGSNLRLTPPAIFAGDNLEISTPKVLSDCIFYHTNCGGMQIEIGFEGV